MSKFFDKSSVPSLFPTKSQQEEITLFSPKSQQEPMDITPPIEIKFDAFTQTDSPVKYYGKSFSGNKKTLRGKAFAICLLTCFKSHLTKNNSNLSDFNVPRYANKNELEKLEKIAMYNDLSDISEFNLGILSLLNLPESDLSEKIGKNKNSILVYFKLMNKLIEQTLDTVEDLYAYLHRNVTDKTLSFAIKLAYEKLDILVFEPLSPDDFFVECLASAIAIFACNNGKPLEALNTALKLDVSIREAKKLIIYLVCDFVAASYGKDFIPEEWLTTFKDHEDLNFFVKKLVR